MLYNYIVCRTQIYLFIYLYNIIYIQQMSAFIQR